MAIQDLSNDVIIGIAKQLKRDSDKNESLNTFVRVCKRWNQCGLPIFYGNIGLSNKTLERFTHSFNVSTYAEFVRSLTLRIEADHGRHPSATALFSNFASGPPAITSGFGCSGLGSSDFDSSGFGSAPTNEPASIEMTLPNRVANFVTLIPNFKKLKSFSLRLEESSYRSVPRATLIELLEALPEICTNLELDTGAQDHREEQEKAHVCEAIRGLLPHMQNVRIRIGAMCSAMFGIGNSSSDGFKPIALPNIRSLVVSCAIFNGQQVQCCGRQDYTTSAKHPGSHGALAWPFITADLAKLVEHSGDNLTHACIYAMNATSGDDASQICQTAIRTDVVTKETSAFPILSIGVPWQGKVSYEVRLHDDSELVLTSPSHVESIAEGQTWQDVRGGARLPTEILKAERTGLPSFATGCAVLPLLEKSEQSWIAENGNEPLSTLLLRERKVGMKLVRAEKRTGNGYRELVPVREVTPQGWIRTNRGSDLERT
jgi:hypothetical protein